MPARLQKFLFGYSGTSLATGLQVVLLPWIAVAVVGLPALHLGWVQASVLLPNLVFLLFGGALADRRDSAAVAALACLGLALCHGGLLLYFSYRIPNLLLLLLYGACLGICTAFLQPARDNLVQRSARDRQGLTTESRVQKTVTWMMLAQYGGQAIGMLLASRFDQWGPQLLLGIQIVVLLLAAAFMLTLRERGEHIAKEDKSPHTLILDGLSQAWRRPALRELIALMAFNGFVHIGIFLVVLPLLAADYDRGASYYATLQLAFVAGTVAATVTMLRRGQGRRPGRGILMCLLYSAALLVAISYGPTPLGLVLLCACWGGVAAASAALGRAIVQLFAPAEYRSRIISIYQLALFGSAALGALAAGVLSEYAAPLTTLMWAGMLSLLAFILVAFSGALREVTITDGEE
ncbi:Predicted arabinose efflux permease, MFS family [Microbulbifer donghaiensis]|uniref:Predicted arabinose efflux permease, MFS family n=1 Tax=Microbulbifer donghaiensis TaxID=494016 RepID=A0A1M4X7V8_9GAMM|nr:MFS transporter [Microbulbifer donghaiensis]SHE89554.1 Predicted arabinose efflux permease, MFS family [Microbulbifer donghaiensis]